MLIQCTKTLLDKLGIKDSELTSSEGYGEFPKSFFAWHANFVSIDRRKASILMNNETRYPICHHHSCLVGRMCILFREFNN
ncbi:DUF6933 domain-containing protein [Calidifontibacillus oryziterrae]|uniref:DUF6933 domain-containing protein n=1 Tax=Calidifontibacillus oryziterrae TaxID=1191699 RepID=UPI003898FB5A